jgi:oxalate decarboxylase
MTGISTVLGAYSSYPMSQRTIPELLRSFSFRVTFNIADWVAHTPKDVLAKNFGVNQSVFDNIPSVNPYILNSTTSNRPVTGPNGELTGNSSYVYHTLQHPSESVPGGGGTFYKIDSTNFPVSKTLAATFVTLKPRGLRELHWHPNVRLLVCP